MQSNPSNYSGGGGRNPIPTTTVALPPLPPRPNTQNNYRSSSNYAPYSNYGGYGSYNNNYGPYGSGFGNYRYNRFGMMGSTMNTDDNRFIQLAEESSRPAFESIESIVHAFGSVSMMLESTFHAVHSSFRAVLGVAEHFGRMKSHFAQIFSAFAVIRTLRWLYRKLLYLIGLRAQDPSMEGAWKNATLTPSSQITEADIKASKSSWPIVMFLAVVFGGPYLIWRLLSTISPPALQNKGWLKGQGEHYRAFAVYPFKAGSQNELSLTPGQALFLAPREQQPSVRGWLLASNGNAYGLVPSNYIQIPRTELNNSPASSSSQEQSLNRGPVMTTTGPGGPVQVAQYRYNLQNQLNQQNQQYTVNQMPPQYPMQNTTSRPQYRTQNTTIPQDSRPHNPQQNPQGPSRSKPQTFQGYVGPHIPPLRNPQGSISPQSNYESTGSDTDSDSDSDDGQGSAPTGAPRPQSNNRAMRRPEPDDVALSTCFETDTRPKINFALHDISEEENTEQAETQEPCQFQGQGRNMKQEPCWFRGQDRNMKQEASLFQGQGRNIIKEMETQLRQGTKSAREMTKGVSVEPINQNMKPGESERVLVFESSKTDCSIPTTSQAQDGARDPGQSNHRKDRERPGTSQSQEGERPVPSQSQEPEQITDPVTKSAPVVNDPKTTKQAQSQQGNENREPRNDPRGAFEKFARRGNGTGASPEVLTVKDLFEDLAIEGQR